MSEANFELRQPTASDGHAGYASATLTDFREWQIALLKTQLPENQRGLINKIISQIGSDMDNQQRAGIVDLLARSVVAESVSAKAGAA